MRALGSDWSSLKLESTIHFKPKLCCQLRSEQDARVSQNYDRAEKDLPSLAHQNQLSVTKLWPCRLPVHSSIESEPFLCGARVSSQGRQVRK